jgi:hypothetical protein
MMQDLDIQSALNPAFLTKRELFAAMAMQGMLANEEINATAQVVAKCSAEHADALLDALAKEAGTETGP